MEELIKPSIDECLFQLNYHQYALFITQGRPFASIEELIDHWLVITEKQINTFKGKASEKLFKSLKNMNAESLATKYKQEDFINFLTEPIDRKLQDLCRKINFTVEQKHKLEEALFNYYVCLKIEQMLKKQTIAKRIESDFKNAITINKAFDANMDNFLKTYSNDKTDPKIRILLNKNIADFKIKMRNDIEFEATGLENSEIDDPLSFAKDYLENNFFKTVLMPGRRPTRSLNGLILSLYKLCYDPQNSTYLVKVMAILEYMNSVNYEKIEGIELTETAIRKRIKDLLKLEREQEKIVEHNTNFLLAQIAKDAKNLPIQ